jgi:hypothetical protein
VGRARVVPARRYPDILQLFLDFLVLLRRSLHMIHINFEGKAGQWTLEITTYPIQTVEIMPL